tara:strand:+ start:146 stop:391 length:246 start_codon:yes stop_codon:yes gene_type:complete
MYTKKRHKNQTTNAQYLFNKNKKNKDQIIEDKKVLRERIAKQVTAYLNSGGQIQQCTPFTYSDSQRVDLTPNQRRSCSGIR